MMTMSIITAAATPTHSLHAFTFLSKPVPKKNLNAATRGISLRVSAKDRSKNRKPLQRGRNLSTEAIQTVQALKRAYQHNNNNNSSVSLEHVFRSKFSRLLKFDMIAVLRELLRQNYCLLALKVFEDVRKENWYRPQVSLYVDMITVMASNELWEETDLLYMYLESESNLEPDTEGFNALLRTLTSCKLTRLAVRCYELMKSVECESDKSTFRILVNGLESLGKSGASAVLRQEAEKYYGESLEFLEEDDEMMVSQN